MGCKDFSWWSEEEKEEAEKEDDEVCCLVKWVIHRSMWEEPFVHLQVPHHPERERESQSVAVSILLVFLHGCTTAAAAALSAARVSLFLIHHQMHYNLD